MFRPGMGGFGGGNMQNLMRQAQKMQEELQAQNAKAEEELENTTLSATAGGGMVEVSITGKKKIVGVKINPNVVDPDDVEMLEDLIVAATNEAIEKANELEKELKPSIPGL
mgnify:CR=1 FL=1